MFSSYFSLLWCRPAVGFNQSWGFVGWKTKESRELRIYTREIMTFGLWVGKDGSETRES